MNSSHRTRRYRPGHVLTTGVRIVDRTRHDLARAELVALRVVVGVGVWRHVGRRYGSGMVGLMVGQVPTGVVGGPVLTDERNPPQAEEPYPSAGLSLVLQRPVDPREDFLRGIARFRLYGPPRGYWGLLGGPYQLSLPGGALMCSPPPRSRLLAPLPWRRSEWPTSAGPWRKLPRYPHREAEPVPPQVACRVVPGIPLMMLNIFVVSQV